MNENNNGGKFFDRSNIDEMTNSNFPNENQNNVDKSIVNAPFNTKIRPYLDYEDDVF